MITVYWKNISQNNRRRFCVKNLSRTAYKAIGVTVGVNGSSCISKSGEKTRKTPEILRFRELFLAEKEKITNKAQAGKYCNFSKQVRTSRGLAQSQFPPDRISNRPTQSTGEPNHWVLLLAEVL